MDSLLLATGPFWPEFSCHIIGQFVAPGHVFNVAVFLAPLRFVVHLLLVWLSFGTIILVIHFGRTRCSLEVIIRV